MHRLRRPRLTYANVVASLALFIALGGTGYAATQLAPNSVGTPQLKRGAVTGAKIAARTRRALRGRTGPTGPRGPEGARGPTGANGTNGLPGADGAVRAKLGYVVGPVTVPTNKTGFPIMGMLVPSVGSYVAIAKLTVTPTGADEIPCGLGTGFGNELGGVDVGAVRGSGVEQTMVLTFAGEFTAPLDGNDTFKLYCDTTGTTSVEVKQAKITLIQVDDVSVVAADA